MDREWMLLTGLGVCALLALALAAALVRGRATTRRDLAAARAETAALREELGRIEGVLSTLERRPDPGPDPGPAPDEREYTITGLGREPSADPATAPVDRALFADLVLRETVVRAASLVHGVRRALSADTRHRVGYEVRREVRRARKQRRADTREAVRQWEARQRAAMVDGADVA